MTEQRGAGWKVWLWGAGSLLVYSTGILGAVDHITSRQVGQLKDSIAAAAEREAEDAKEITEQLRQIGDDIQALQLFNASADGKDEAQDKALERIEAWMQDHSKDDAHQAQKVWNTAMEARVKKLEDRQGDP